MADRKTLMVVGAGVSTEAELPTSQKLKTKIASILDIRFEEFKNRTGDGAVCDALRYAVQAQDPPSTDINPYLHAALRIRDAMPQAPSIDSFIDVHQGDEKIELCGKLAIVRAILEAEHHSHMYVDPLQAGSKIRFDVLAGTWFNSFFQLLVENCRIVDLQKRMKSVALIIFNYDRCVEHFLYHSLQNYYDMDEKVAADLVQSIEIYHPYGTVGNLPWQPGGSSVVFGDELHPQRLLNVSKGIKTFTEGTDPDSSEIIDIRKLMLESNIILFLGFAFHRLNLELLTPENPSHEIFSNRKCFATAKGISDSDCVQIEAELANSFLGHVGSIELRVDLDCRQLFHEYWRQLSLIK